MPSHPAPVDVRPVTPADADAVLALWRVVFPEYGDPSHPQRDAAAAIARKLAFGDGLFWLAERDGAVAGSAMAGYDGHRGWLYSVGVRPDLRGAGIARGLVAEAERALAARGCPKVNLLGGERPGSGDALEAVRVSARPGGRPEARRAGAGVRAVLARAALVIRGRAAACPTPRTSERQRAKLRG